ncbi:MAG: 4Fe-4S dicluster domain-containing protein [Pedosphaera sp.]|nr:4Fe-4S dicluster domain-containing protein [Pedosphaera sp.]
MKIIPPPCPEPDTGPKYWRSLDHLAETPEFKQWAAREFPDGASELTDPVTRRSFMQLMSASFALAGIGLTGCRKPEEYIHPFSKMPEGYVHGVAQYYATAMPGRGGAVPLLVKSSDGRPTKIEGNLGHPESGGGTNVFAQASILDLYDPDRATRFTSAGSTATREAAIDELRQIEVRFGQNRGDGLSFLVERNNSPTRARLQALIAQKYPQATWHVYEPADMGFEAQALTIAFGQPVIASYRFGTASAILSLDCDFAGAEDNAWKHIRGYAAGRRVEKPGDKMSRLYVVEGLLTVTGSNADHRLRISTSSVVKIGARVAIEVLKQTNFPATPELNAALQQLANGAPDAEKWAVECAKDLVAQRGKALVVAGYRQPVAAHLVAAVMNVALGSTQGGAAPVSYLTAPSIGAEGTIGQLAQALNSGQVNTLVISGGNPAYNAPVDLIWAQTQRKAKKVIRLGYYEDETSTASDFQIPQAHYLESWGDARTPDGTIVGIQPLIEPLFGGMTEIEVLARAAGLAQTSPYELVRETFANNAGGENEPRWKKFLHDGFLAESAHRPVLVALRSSATAQALGGQQSVPAPSVEKLEVVFFRDSKLDDGRYNNNGWLQELPDPITKVVWDNPILLSRKTAVELGVKTGDVIEVKVGDLKVQGPVAVQPGLADFTLGLALGYGRERAGRIGGFGGQKVGFSAYEVRGSAAPFVASGVERPSRLDRSHRVVTTQDHGVMEGRPIIREANWQQFQQKPAFAKNMDLEAHAPNAGPIYKHPYDKHPNGKNGGTDLRDDRRQILQSEVHQWGMSIDLNSCVGCGACVIACQSENNIPIVGKDQIFKNREMHWMRIDRYFSSSRENPEEAADDPQVNMQPMLCQHCESAPCEMVCPVNATVHDEEGINVMAYNRCVGTRYCSNNCAWKVRRFNFFDFNKRPLTALYQGPLATRPKDEVDIVKMAKNPDVSIRMRGVMEKCTFCIQRIEGAKISQKVKAGATDQVRVPEGTFTTACAQVCPAEAIAFGNLLDPESRVSKLKGQARDYAVLGFLDTKPRVTYLARIRNPNPEMPDYYKMPASLQEYEEHRHDDPFASHGAGAAHGEPVGAEKKGAH